MFGFGRNRDIHIGRRHQSMAGLGSGPLSVEEGARNSVFRSKWAASRASLGANIAGGDMGGRSMPGRSMYSGMGAEIESNASRFIGRSSFTNSGGLFRATGMGARVSMSAEAGAAATVGGRMGNLMSGKAGSFLRSGASQAGLGLQRFGSRSFNAPMGLGRMTYGRAGVAGGLGLLAVSQGANMMDRMRYGDYGGAMLSGAVAGAAGYGAYKAAMGKMALQKHFSNAAAFLMKNIR